MRILLTFLLLTSSLFASMKVYDSIEDAPSSASLYMMVDGGSFVDVNTLPKSYQVRFTKNPDAYVKVEKVKGKWVIPEVQIQVAEAFVEIELEEIPETIIEPEPEPVKAPKITRSSKVPPTSQPIAKREVKPKPKVKRTPWRKPLPTLASVMKEKDILISKFKNEAKKKINVIIQKAKAGRAEGIIEGSLEDVKYYTKIAEVAKKDCDFDPIHIRTNFEKYITSYKNSVSKEKKALNNDLEKLKVSLVKMDKIPEAEEVDEIIKTEGRWVIFKKVRQPTRYVRVVPQAFKERRKDQLNRMITNLERRVKFFPAGSPRTEMTKTRLKMLKEELKNL